MRNSNTLHPFFNAKAVKKCLPSLAVTMSLLFTVGCDGDPTNNEVDLSSVDLDNSVEVIWPQRNLAFAECMAIAAREAYSELSETKGRVCDELLTEPFAHLPQYGTDVLRVFKRDVAANNAVHTDLIIAFTGTRTPDVGDIARDLESQILLNYNNEFDADHADALALSGEEKVGGGFDSRWENHAAIVKDAIDSISVEPTESAQIKTLSIIVTGHSLGAATATRAAFDLDRSLQNNRITLWSFNSPRVGNEAFAQAYTNAITSCSVIDEGCFIVRQFTRSGDPIHKLPLLMHHPIWNPDQDEETRQSTGDVTQRTLDYCAHYHAPRASTLNLAQNHKLDLWRTNLYEIPSDHIECMLGKDFNKL